MKRLVLILLLALPLFAMAKDALVITDNGLVINKKNCTLTLANGDVLKIEKVQIVDSFEDLKVELVDSFSDFKVEKTGNDEYYISIPSCNCNRIKIVDSFADIKIRIVDSFADLKVEVSK